MTQLFSTLIESPLVYRFGWTLIHFLWQGAAVAVLLAIALSLMARASATRRYLVATLAMVLMVLLPVVTLQLVPAPPAGTREVPVTPIISTELPANRATPLAARESPSPMLNPSSPSPTTVHELPATSTIAVSTGTGTPPIPLAARLQFLLPYLVSAWSLGVLLLSLYHLGGFVAIQRIKSLRTEPPTALAASLLAKLTRRMKLSRPVKLLTSTLVQTPVVLGYLRPVILFPAAILSGLTPEQLEAILAHELAHIRRHDYLVNLGQALAETLLFYHPAIWWVSQRIRQERENCCDDAAAQICGDRFIYAQALISLEELRPANPLALAATGGSMLARIRRLLNIPVPRYSRTRSILVAMTALSCVILCIIFAGCLTGNNNPNQPATTRATTQPAAQEYNFDRGSSTELLLGHYDPDTAKPRLYAIGLYERSRMPPFPALYGWAVKGDVAPGSFELIARLPGDSTPLKILSYARTGTQLDIRLALSPKRSDRADYLWGQLPQKLPAGKYHLTLTAIEYEERDGKLIPLPPSDIRAFYQLECSFEVAAALEPLELRGINLSFTRIVTIEKEPDLFEEVPPGSKSWQLRKEVLPLEVRLNGTIYYVPGKDTFYIQYDDPGSSRQTFFGPVTDTAAFKKLKSLVPATTPATRGAGALTTGPSTAPSTATAPADTAVIQQADYAEMEELARVWREFAEALMRDDAKGMVAKVYAGDADEAAAVQSNVAFWLARRAVAKEAVKWLGDEGKELLPEPMLLDDDIRQRLEWMGEGRKASVQGDWAMLEARGWSPSYRRTKEGWRVDFGMRWNTQFGKTAAEKKAALDKKTAGMKKVAEKIGRHEFVDLEAAKAGMVMVLHAQEHGAETLPADEAGKRWRERAAKAGNSAVEKFTFELIAELHASKLMQTGIPGSWEIECPAEGTTDAAGELSRMGIDALPALAEALDDVTLTKTQWSRHGGPGEPVRVCDIVAGILMRIGDRRFSIGEGDKNNELWAWPNNENLAAEFRKDVLQWYAENRKRTKNERLIADLGDKNFHNRMYGAENLAQRGAKEAGPGLEKYMEMSLARLKARQGWSLLELATCAKAMIDLKDTHAVAVLKQTTEYLAKNPPSEEREEREANTVYNALAYLQKFAEKPISPTTSLAPATATAPTTATTTSTAPSGAGAPTTVPSTAPPNSAAPGTQTWTPPYTDDQSKQFAAKLPAIQYPTNIPDACKTLGIDRAKLDRNQLMKNIVVGQYSCTFTHLSPTYHIAFDSHLGGTVKPDDPNTIDGVRIYAVAAPATSPATAPASAPATEPAAPIKSGGSSLVLTDQGAHYAAVPSTNPGPATLPAATQASQPATAPATTQAADDALWSKPVAGLSGRLVAAQPTIAPGQAFTVTVQLRNTTDHPLVVQSRNPFCFASTLKSFTGQPVRTTMGRGDVAYGPAFLTLEPGKTLELPYAGSAPDAKDATLDTVLNIWSLPLGTYSFSATYTSPAGGGKTPANAWTGTLDLPPITLTVAALQPSSAPAMSRPSTAGSVPTTAPRAAEMKESGWGDEVQGLQAELVVGNGGEYRRSTGLGLEIRVRNIGKQAVAYTRLGVVPEVEAREAGGKVMRLRPVDQAPVNNNQGALAVGETLSWAAALERMEGTASWKAGTEVELLVRFGVAEGSERRGPGEAVTSLPVKVKMAEDFPAELKSGEIPEAWSAGTTLIYRERGMWLGSTWLKVDGQGRALLMRSDGRQDAEIPAGVYRAQLSAEKLGALAGAVRQHEFKERKDRWAETDVEETTVVVSVGGAAARSQFESPAEKGDAALRAFRAEMRKIVLAVVKASTGAATQGATRGAEMRELAGRIGDTKWEVWGPAVFEAGKLVRGEAATADMTVYEPLVEPLFERAKWSGISLGGKEGWAAAEALVRIGRPAVATLQQKITSKDERDRWTAMDLLSRIGEPKALVLSSARALLKDANYYARWKAIEALGKLGKDAKEAVGDLEADAGDGFESNQIRVQLALIRIQGPSEERIKDIASYMRHRSQDSPARFAAEVLGEIGAPARIAEPDFLEAIKEGDTNLRIGAAGAIGKTGADSEALIAVLLDRVKNDPELYVRQAAAMSLGLIGPKARAALPALREVAKAGEAWWGWADAIKRIEAEGAATRAAASQTQPANDATRKAVEILHANMGTLNVTMWPWPCGRQWKLALLRPQQGVKAALEDGLLELSEEQAAAVVDRLAKAGFFEAAKRNEQKADWPEGWIWRGISIGADNTSPWCQTDWQESAKWLGAIREAVDGPAREVIDGYLGDLKWWAGRAAPKSKIAAQMIEDTRIRRGTGGLALSLVYVGPQVKMTTAKASITLSTTDYEGGKPQPYAWGVVSEADAIRVIDVLDAQEFFSLGKATDKWSVDDTDAPHFLLRVNVPEGGPVLEMRMELDAALVQTLDALRKSLHDTTAAEKMDEVVGYIYANAPAESLKRAPVGGTTKPAATSQTQPATRAAGEGEIPETEEIVLSVEADRAVAAIGEPILMTLRFKNVGKSTYWMEEDHLGTFHGGFAVRDAEGKAVGNPYAFGEGMGAIDGPFSKHEIKPGGEVVYQRLLNECVGFEKPGEYSVETAGGVRTSQKYEAGGYRRVKASSTKITIRDYDRAKRAADIGKMVAAYIAGGTLPEEFPVDRKYILNMGNSLGTLRLLVFYNDPSLTGFFLDVMEGTDWNAYARCGLLGMKDRAAVLTALEERLGHPEAHDGGKLIYAYVALKYPQADFRDREKSKAVYEQRQAAEAKYRGMALALVKADKEHRYGYLVPWLVSGPATGGPDDLFLMEYLFRGQPKFEWVQHSAYALERVELPRDLEPALAEQLKVRDWTVCDAVMRQLLRMDRAKYLAVLREDKDSAQNGRRFSPTMYELLEVRAGPASAPATVPATTRGAAETAPARTPTTYPTHVANRDAWGPYLPATDELLKGAPREKMAGVFAAMPDAYAREIGELLAKMVQEDKQFVQPADPAKLAEKERLDWLVYKLRDVAEREAFVPGKCQVLFYPRDPQSPAVQLRKMGKAAVPTLMGLLDDRRPTRSSGEALNMGAVLRYCDAALEILEAISGQVFDGRTWRGAYLSTATPEERVKIVGRVQEWWKANQGKTEVEWIHESLEKAAVGNMWNRLAFAERLVELEGAASVPVLRKCRVAERENPHLVRLLWQAGGKEVLEDLKQATQSANADIRGQGYRYLIEGGQKEYVGKSADDLARAALHPSTEYKGTAGEREFVPLMTLPNPDGRVSVPHCG